MNCPACGKTNPADSRFCNGCGAELALPAAPATAPSAAPAPPLPASFAGGRYNVRAFLGEGGTKRVYLAHDTKLDRDVAFALIKTEGLDADGIVRVGREAQAMGKLGDNAHIVTILDTGDEAGAPYMSVSASKTGWSLGGTAGVSRSPRQSMPTVPARSFAMPNLRWRHCDGQRGDADTTHDRHDSAIVCGICAASHPGDVLRHNFHHHPHVARFVVRVFVLVHVLLRQFVDALGSLSGL